MSKRVPPGTGATLEAALLALPDPVPPGTYDALAATWGCTSKAVRNRMNRLRSQGRTQAHGLGHRPWTPADVAALEAAWWESGLPALAVRLRRSHLALCQQLVQRGILDSDPTPDTKRATGQAGG